MTAKWCSYCGSRHGEGRLACPGELRPTEPERHGWRVTVETPDGMEAYGVLLAPCEIGWRARVLTYPNILWTVPGGGVTMKFLGDTPRAAEESAIRFVEEYIAKRGLLRRDAILPVEVGAFALQDRAGGRAGPPPIFSGGPAPRKLRTIPLLYGPTSPLVRAVTANLSESGLFVTTGQPLHPGSPVVIALDLEADSVQVRGGVVWRRFDPELGRQPGMGVRLDEAPLLYTRYVREIP